MMKIQSLYAIISRLSKREKTILYAAAFVLSFTILDRMIISPIFSRMKSLDDEIRESESDVRSDLRVLSHKDRILAEKKQYSSFYGALKTDEEEMTAVLKEVENLASTASIDLANLKPGNITEIRSSKVYSVNLNCESEMEQIARFMYSIESAKTLLSIDKYQISPKSKESSVARCRMTVSKIIIP